MRKNEEKRGNELIYTVDNTTGIMYNEIVDEMKIPYRIIQEADNLSKCTRIPFTFWLSYLAKEGLPSKDPVVGLGSREDSEGCKALLT